MNYFSYRNVLVATALSFTYILPAHSQNKDFFPDKEMQGKSLDIEDFDEKRFLKDRYQNFTLKTILLPADQSDWSRLRYLDREKIVSVRVFGFHHINDREVIDATTNDPKYLKMFGAGIKSDAVLREPTSDIALSGGAYGGGNYQGVLRFEIKDEEPIIVGVGFCNFYLDVWYGSFRQSFYSRPLAEAVKRYLKSEHQIEMPEEMYQRTSGLMKMKLPDCFNEQK